MCRRASDKLDTKVTGRNNIWFARLAEHFDSDGARGFPVRVFQRDGVGSGVRHFHVSDARWRHVAYDVDVDTPAADQWPSVEVPRDPRRGGRTVR